MPIEPPPLTHAQIAARMHAVITQWLGNAFDIDRMLADPAEAREVLFVCHASNRPELVRLAQQWLALGPVPVNLGAARQPGAKGGSLPGLDQVVEPPLPAPGRVRQDTPWARDTSGFGASMPGALPMTPREPESSRWLQRPRWLGGAGRGRRA